VNKEIEGTTFLVHLISHVVPVLNFLQPVSQVGPDTVLVLHYNLPLFLKEKHKLQSP